MYYRLQITVIKKRLSIIKIMDQVEIRGEAAFATEQEEDTLHKGLTTKSVLDTA
jgi:hypothetical protein